MDSDWEIEYEPEDVSFGNGLDFQVMSITELPLEFLADLESKQEEISGRRLWPGSLILAQYLTHISEDIKGRTVLELGAGSGICSMLARRLGAAVVMVTDGDDECIKLMGQNLSSNGFNDDPQIAARLLRWGDRPSKELFEEYLNSTNSLSLVESGKFDYVIAGDVLYKRALLGPFFSCAAELLLPTAPPGAAGGGGGGAGGGGGGALLLCHLPRAGVTHDIVQQSAAEHGFKLTIVYETGTSSSRQCQPAEEKIEGGEERGSASSSSMTDHQEKHQRNAAAINEEGGQRIGTADWKKGLAQLPGLDNEDLEKAKIYKLEKMEV